MEGRVLKLGDDIDTDSILPGRYLTLTEPEDLGKHVMEGYDLHYKDKIQEGDVIVAGSNFGCGSSREHAPIALKAAGIKAVVAKSFARIFYRNAINIGLALVEAPEGPDDINEEDTVKIDLENGTLEDETQNTNYSTTKLPEFMFEILENDGLINYLNRTRFNE
ncbi:3-isopropylmalate dehydratase small subunit [Candidatus Methanosphaera massiliense]|uniref:3-isopropylmalate dehydratase small subunit n=1 Tax=Methanosphaera TaxID=2316 RepID=UPI0023807636|nr:3-isopropylmalate dehydratase small subunit [Candidatus Methanosphaera massiliense]MDD6285966.1 3-isopropylmalate dehydratase small subunit [Methanobacteriaceae archaeon]MDE4077869.1 3-isopropylmalate dehydratase small subunit [Candidatus Methanosphaera massiliense]MDY2744693.1 3-isopropylmalate dehydratase small subunit [Methanosphaera sp.]